MKRWHFKFEHAGQFGSLWSVPFDANNDLNKVSALCKSIEILRNQFRLTKHEILDASCQMLEDPGQN